MIGELAMSHAVFESTRPTEVDMQEAYERRRRLRHVQMHGTDSTYVPGRSFPCSGGLVVVDETAAMVIVECDACGYQTSWRRESVPAGVEAF